MKESEIAQLLPGVFQRTLYPANPLRAVLASMEELHAPAERILSEIDTICDPSRTPDEFVAFLARWVDLERIFSKQSAETDGIEVPISTGLGRLRELTSAAAQLSKWRGTRQGLIRFLETATGSAGFAVDESVTDSKGKVRAFHIRVRAPRAVEEHRPLIEKIIEVERPAYVTWELEFSKE